MRIAVFGTGGVGGYYGGRLAQAGADVTFIARGEHLRAIQADGLRVESVNGGFQIKPARATDDTKTVSAVDLVLVAIKTWQLPDSFTALASLLGDRTLLLPLLNGVEAPQQLAEQFGPEHVLGGVAKIFSLIAAPGCIRHLGGPASVEFGHLDNSPSEAVAHINELFARAGIRSHVVRDIQVALWEKFLFVTPVGGVGAVTRAPVGVFRTLTEIRQMLADAMREIWCVARARHIELADDLVARSIQFIDALPEAGTTSLQRDIMAGHRSELEAWNGAVVRLGTAAGIPTPVNAFLYGSLLSQERKAQGLVKF